MFTKIWQLLQQLWHLPEKIRQFLNEDEQERQKQAKKRTQQKAKPWQQQEAANEALRQAEPLKARGDGYELFIGREFEQRGDLVIYNGFIRGYGDQGVDLIVISKKNRSVNLVQCKNWFRYKLTVERMVEIYEKLVNYTPDYFDIPYEQITYYQAIPKERHLIDEWIEQSREYPIRKSLYIASDRVVDLTLGEHLKMTAENIFRYKEMKMVVKRWTT